MADHPSSPASRGLSPRVRGLLTLPLVIVLAAGMVGVLAIPALTVAEGAVTAVGDELLSVPPMPEVQEPAQRSVVFAADGTRLDVLAGEQNRSIVTLEDIPDVVEEAVIAAEDANFYEHDGVNPRAIARAALRNAVAGEIEQGGSTITQQYVKNALLSPKQTIERKIREAIYAIELEKELSKDEILERYLNISYLGHGAYGVQAASQYYFGRPVTQISVAQAALLAGMIRAPAVNDPIDNPERARQRRDTVLRQMANQGYISQEQAERDARIPIEGLLDVSPLPPPEYPFFVEYVKKQLLALPELGETRADRVEALFSGGLRVHTSIHPGKQQVAKDSIAAQLPDPVNGPMGALVSVAPETGQILAMATGPDQFGDCEGDPNACARTKVNPIAPGMGGSGRQPGSAFKPILLATALENGFTPGWATNTDSDQPIEGCGRPGTTWTPENYAPGEGGTTGMVEAITESNNVYHAKLIREVGPQKVHDMARRLGIRGRYQPVCSLSLGTASVFPIDMVAAYATFANRGVRCDPYAIQRVTDAEGNVLYERGPDCERVTSERVAATVSTLLQRVVEQGTATRAQIGREAAGKTGTTDDWKDAWFIGYTPKVATASWVGFENPTPMIGMLGYAHVAGGTVPADIWRTYMGTVMEPYAPGDLPDVPLEQYLDPELPDDEDEGEDQDDGRGR